MEAQAKNSSKEVAELSARLAQWKSLKSQITEAVEMERAKLTDPEEVQRSKGDAMIRRIEVIANSNPFFFGDIKEYADLILTSNSYNDMKALIEQLKTQAKGQQSMVNSIIAANKSAEAASKFEIETLKLQVALLKEAPVEVVAKTDQRSDIPVSTSMAENNIPAHIMTQIKADAQEHWGTNYRMIESQIKDQIKDYITLQELVAAGQCNGVSGEVFRRIYKEASDYWGGKYGMVISQIKEQTSAYKRLNSR